MNTGLVVLMSMAAVFVAAVGVSFGKLARWFFKPRHMKWLQKTFWFIVVVSAITAIVSL